MRRLDRYLWRELLPPFLAGTLVFIAVILVNTLASNSAQLLALNPPWPVVLRWLAYRVPIILTFALPVGCLLATSLVIIRQARDRELVGWRMGGVSLRRLFWPCYSAGLLVSVLALLNNELVAPRFREKADQVLVERIIQSPGSWVKSDMPLRAGDDSVAHVGRVDLRKNELYFVLIYRLRDGRPREAWCAPRCVLEQGRWQLRDGQHNWFDERGRLVRTERFERSPVAFAQDLAEMWSEVNEPDQLPAAELRRRLRLYNQAGDAPNAIRTRYFLHAKFAIPCTCLVFCLLAAPLSFACAGPRAHPYAGLVITIAVVFFCNGTINWAKAIALSGPQAWLPPVLAAWLHVLVFGGLALVLTARYGR